jgi:CheY-specific phosphatase CheX
VNQSELVVSSEMLDRLVDGLVTSTTTAMGEFAGTDVVTAGTTQTPSLAPAGAVRASIDLSGELLQRLTMTFSPAMASTLASRALRETMIEPDSELVGDCLGEIANVVAGQAKTLFVDTPLHFSLSPPKIERGWSSVVDVASRPHVSIAFACDLGEFWVTVFIKSKTIKQS